MGTTKDHPLGIHEVPQVNKKHNKRIKQLNLENELSLLGVGCGRFGSVSDLYQTKTMMLVFSVFSIFGSWFLKTRNQKPKPNHEVFRNFRYYSYIFIIWTILFFWYIYLNFIFSIFSWRQGIWLYYSVMMTSST